MQRPRVLVVDDSVVDRTVLAQILKSEAEVIEAAGRADALKLARSKGVFDVAFVDLVLESADDGFSLIESLRADAPDMDTRFVIITGRSTDESLRRASRSGVHDYLLKPPRPEEVLFKVRQQFETVNYHRHLRATVAEFRAERGELIGDSECMQKVRHEIAMYAQTNARVLILGESGTGKELAARAIHEGSERSNSSFVAINCAAIPRDLMPSELFGHAKGAFTGAHTSRKGKFLEADGGTLFLDEIGELDLGLQGALLRVMDSGELQVVGGTGLRRVDVRVIAATNKDLEQEVQAGRFREDLYYRLNVGCIRMPNLNERRSDIPLLVAALSCRLAREMKGQVPTFEPSALDYLEKYRWKGNVRELRNVIERLMIIVPHGPIKRSHVRECLRVSPPAASMDASVTWLDELVRMQDLEKALRYVERKVIERALELNNDNKSATARSLGTTRQIVHKRLVQYKEGGAR